MRRNAWVALGLAFAMLVAIPAEAGTRTTSKKKKGTSPLSGFRLAEIQPFTHHDDQEGHKIWFCDPVAMAEFGLPVGMPEQTAGDIVFGMGWAVLDDVQAWRFRELVNGRLSLQVDNDSGDAEDWGTLLHVEMVNGLWTVKEGSITHGPVPDTVWTAGGDDVGEFAWSEPYAASARGTNSSVWRTDWEFSVNLLGGHYRLFDVYFEITAGTNGNGAGDPPGPIVQYYDTCEFEVV